MAFKIFQDGDTLYAADLNGNFATPVITGGSINGCPIGATTPATGTFTNLAAQSLSLSSTLSVTAPSQTDNSNAVITSAWFRTYIANNNITGGSGSGSGSGTTGTTYGGDGTAGILNINSSGGITVRNAAEFVPWNFYSPGANAGWAWMVDSPRTINGVHYGGVQGGGSFTWSLYVGGSLQTMTSGGATAGAAVSSNTLATPITLQPYTLVYFVITAVTGTVNSGMLQPYGNYA